MPELKLRLHCDLLLFGRVRRIKPVLPQRLKTRTFRPTGKSTLAIAANVRIGREIIGERTFQNAEVKALADRPV